MAPKKIKSFEEYLTAMTELIKAEPENVFKNSLEDFAKEIDKQFRADMAVVQDNWLAKLDTKLDDETLDKLVNREPGVRKALDANLNTEQKKALDAYTNNAMLLGQADVFSSFDQYNFNAMIYAWPLWTAMYSTSWVFAKIIDRTGADIIRNGWKISVSPERKYQFRSLDGKLFREDITPVYDLSYTYKRMNRVLPYVVNAAKWMYLYGGSVICLLDDSITDISEYEKPLDLKNLKDAKLNFIVADRWQGVTASAEFVTDDESPDFNSPKYYNVRTPNGSSYRFHHTRVARFVNGEPPNFLKTMLMGWGLPLGVRVYNDINRDERIKNMITSLLSKYNLEIVQTAGMKQYMHGELTPEHEAELDAKLSMINRYRHFNSMMFLDKDDQYTRMDGNVGGLYQLFDSNTRAVTGAASMPVVLLYGDQSQGLSGSSFDDLRLWEDHLESERGSKMKRPIHKITEWLLAADGIVDEEFSTKFNSSLPKTMNERIDETRAVLDMYQQLISMGLYDLNMVREELKERDDLLLGGQIHLVTEEKLEEIEEEAEDDFEGDFDSELGTFRDDDLGSGDFDDFDDIGGDFDEPDLGEE